ncbi:TIGR02300 family protein [Leptospira alstonii]|uniref:TIGR02300-like family protein n=2 Tax=Leptospira alstonii TaxID=28452 RepID=M6CNX0_9LEPT|nr:TIGR02300 family protein [Leptospira alstonii]EMJ93414.1 TIGR02300-like family protein [Leptospira alstonii serovar Sichuan str. 79601]EQA80361.1 TIGR02300-like family protein [Leptospira alstonii serovar Pingchang str. 80-412]
MANSKKTKSKKTATVAAKKKATAKKVAPKKGNASAKKKVEIIKKALSSPSAKSKSAAVTKKVSGGAPLNPLGKKWTCHTCSTKFYDLNKEEKICPKCGADQNKRPVTRTRTVRPRVVEEEEIIDEETLVEDEEMEFTEEPLEEALDEDDNEAEETEE